MTQAPTPGPLSKCAHDGYEVDTAGQPVRCAECGDRLALGGQQGEVRRARIIAKEMKVHADRILAEIEAGDFVKLHNWCVAQNECKHTNTGAYLECVSDARNEGAFAYCREV